MEKIKSPAIVADGIAKVFLASEASKEAAEISDINIPEEMEMSGTPGVVVRVCMTKICEYYKCKMQDIVTYNCQKMFDIQEFFYHAPSRYEEKNKDLIVKFEPYTSNYPHIKFCSNNSLGSAKADGIHFYRYSNNGVTFDYFTIHYYDGRNDYLWMGCENKNAFKFLSMAQKRNKLIEKNLSKANCKKPVLEKDLFDAAYLNTVKFLENVPTYSKYGIRPTRGLIFSGLPGNGKTMLCRYLMSESTAKGYSCEVVTSKDLEKAYENNELEDVMNSSNFILFDDVDINFLTRKRNENQANQKMACAILGAMDGVFKRSSHNSEKSSNLKKNLKKLGVVRIFTTNENVQNIDTAFLRPGRIDKVLHFHLPSENMRRTLIMETWNSDILENIDVNFVVQNTENCSFSEIEEIKGILVSNTISDSIESGKMEWNVQKAVEDFKNRIQIS